MNRNYSKELERIIQKRGNEFPRLLLHCCCGPCSTSVLEYLSRYFDISVLWYNPNIFPEAEFEKRFRTLIEVIQKMGLSDRIHFHFEQNTAHEEEFFDRQLGESLNWFGL